MNINSGLIQRAITFYGCELATVPYLVDADIMNWTCPVGANDKRLTHVNGKQYVASAEQSFLQLEKEGKLPKFSVPLMALTPCFRDEEVLDESHFNIFLKLEIFDYNCKESTVDWALFWAKKMVHFFNFEGLFTQIIKTDIGYDVLSEDGLELGSFGYRTSPKGVRYVYGTGLAEPRASLALEKAKRC